MQYQYDQQGAQQAALVSNLNTERFLQVKWPQGQQKTHIFCTTIIVLIFCLNFYVKSGYKRTLEIKLKSQSWSQVSTYSVICYGEWIIIPRFLGHVKYLWNYSLHPVGQAAKKKLIMNKKNIFFK
jgi:hypothetical protein